MKNPDSTTLDPSYIQRRAFATIGVSFRPHGEIFPSFSSKAELLFPDLGKLLEKSSDLEVRIDFGLVPFIDDV